MLGKLLKYDLKWVYKVVVVFYILSLIFSCIGRGLSYIPNSVIFSVVSQITKGIAISMMISSLINCLMRLWARFIKNVYKDESYLTHTLPVKRGYIYLSKFLSALISIFTTVIVIIGCLFVCYYSQENIEMIKKILEITASTYNLTVIGLLILISVVISMQIILVTLLGYVGIILGYKSNKNKMVKTLVISFALYMITQMVTLILVFLVGLFNPSIMNLVNTVDVIDVDIIRYLMYMAMFIYVVYIIFYYVLGKKQFQKGVNVD